MLQDLIQSSLVIHQYYHDCGTRIVLTIAIEKSGEVKNCMAMLGHELAS